MAIRDATDPLVGRLSRTAPLLALEEWRYAMQLTH